jgi:hypothetical protein
MRVSFKASRDLTQNIGNVAKLRQKGYVFPDGDPTNLFKVLTPWAQGQRMLKPPADESLIKREVGAFLQAIAGVEKWAKRLISREPLAVTIHK